MAFRLTRLNNLLECPICLDECEDPRNLPCGHSLCCKCLDQHIKTSARGRFYSCPSCRCEYQVPTGGASSMPTSFVLKNVKEIIQEQASTNRLSPPPSSRGASKCDQHPRVSIDMYCDTCRIPVCMKCCLLKHKEHQYSEIKEAANESKTLLCKLKGTARDIVSVLEENIQQLDVSEIDINTDCEEACRQVHDSAQEIRSLVTRREKAIVEEIRQAQHHALVQVEAAYKLAEAQKAEIESLLSQVQALIMSEDAIAQVTQATVLQEQLRQHESPQLESVTLELNLKKEVQSLSALKESLGAVNICQTTTKQDSLGSALDEETKVSLGSPLLNLKPRVGDNVSGLAMVGDLICATGYNRPYLWMHNIRTSTDRQHALDGLSAAGMTTVHEDTLVITDFNHRMHMIKVDQQMNIREHVVKDIFFNASDVSLDPVNETLINVSYTDNDIVVCDTRGNVEKKVCLKTDIPDMRKALSSADGYIVLDGAESGKLHWVNSRGVVTHTYDGNLSVPSHIVQDRQGRVIIADQGNHRLHLVGVNKQLSQYLLTGEDEVQYPTCSFLDETKARLLVGYSDKLNTIRVRMYNWPFASVPPSRDSTSRTIHKLSVKLAKYQ